MNWIEKNEAQILRNDVWVMTCCGGYLHQFTCEMKVLVSFDTTLNWRGSQYLLLYSSNLFLVFVSYQCFLLVFNERIILKWTHFNGNNTHQSEELITLYFIAPWLYGMCKHGNMWPAFEPCSPFLSLLLSFSGDSRRGLLQDFLYFRLLS